METSVAGEQERRFYELYAWVIMPNHVHLPILPKVGVPVIMRWMKGSTARRANTACSTISTFAVLPSPGQG